MTLEVRFDPDSVDADGIVRSFARLSKEAKVAFWCAFAHSLTVDVRAILMDETVSRPRLDRLKAINEIFHQVTSCLNPIKRQSAEPYDDAELLRAILTDAGEGGLRPALLRAAAAADRTVRRTAPSARQPAPAVSD